MIQLDLADIQGNINRPYGRFGFPHTRHLFFALHGAAAGRRFVQGVRPRVTTAEPWPMRPQPDGSQAVEKPKITLNIGFTYQGLRALDLPTRTLRLLPDEFIDGMSCRADILGDIGPSAPDHWDRVWRGEPHPAHIWVSLNVAADDQGRPLAVLGEWTEWLEGLAKACDGVVLLEGHGADGKGRWQDSCAIMGEGPGGTRRPLPLEHFGFTDGIGDPAFRGQFEGAAAKLAAIGGGKIAEGPYDIDTSWSPLETGEFILGQVDEGQELPVATQPESFMRNGSFMVWRKLREDVDAFDSYVRAQASLWLRAQGMGEETEANKREAAETICAKFIGRWRSGIPLVAAPTWADNLALMDRYADCIDVSLRKPRDSQWQVRMAEFSRLLTGFRYGDDLDGGKCPFGAHIRRANPRDMLDPQISAVEGDSTLTNRRRILRRGLPYEDAGGERGVVFMAICASLFRQFEFIQQQWINYGLDFDAGNDTCPLVGARYGDDKCVIPAGPANEAPFIAADLPQFVVTRGGDYFFMPSMSAIRMIAMGAIDPT